jgi:hypothetical protein
VQNKVYANYYSEFNETLVLDDEAGDSFQTITLEHNCLDGVQDGAP